MRKARIQWGLVLAVCLLAALVSVSAAEGGSIESLTCRTEDGRLTAEAVCAAERDAVLVCGVLGSDGQLLCARSAEVTGGGKTQTPSLDFPAGLTGISQVRGFLLDRETGRPLCPPTDGENTAAAGDFVVTGGFEGTDYVFEEGFLVVLSHRPLTVRNADPEKETTNQIGVASGVNADVTLAGVNINRGTEAGPAFVIAYTGAGDVTVTLEDETENTLYGGPGGAGLQKNGEEGSLTIRGEGGLLAVGGSGSAGIGGSRDASASNIRIDGGTILALGGNGLGGAGIGGGCNGDGTDITINGGDVTACGSYSAGTVTFTAYGRTYTSPDGQGGAGIGGGYNGGGLRITVTGGTVTACGASRAAGIGGGQFKTLSPASPDFRGNRALGSEITMSGGTVAARGRAGGAGIGGGYCGDGTDITITGGTVIATGGSTESQNVLGVNAGAGIGGGTYGGAQNLGGGAGRRITISGGRVTATGGVDKDLYNDPAYGAAGIGGGYAGPGQEIAVTGGTVTAAGQGGGAGIGGGYAGGAEEIALSGGGVLAKGGAIGAYGVKAPAVGRGATCQSGRTYLTGERVYFGETTGAVFLDGTLNGTMVSVREDLVLPAAFLTIGADQTLTVEAGASLTVPEGVSLRNDGTIWYREEPCPVTPTEGVTGNPPQLYTRSSVRFDANGGAWEGGETALLRETEPGTALTDWPEAPARPGWEFAGWNTRADGAGETVSSSEPVDGNRTLYGAWIRLRGLTAQGPAGSYEYRGDVLVILTGDPVTIRNRDPEVVTTDTIRVESGVDADLTLAGVRINAGSTGGYDGSTRTTTLGLAGLEIAPGGGQVTITLAAGTDNGLKGGYGAAGLQKNGGEGTLTIRGTGSLTATGGSYAAGVGGGQRQSAAGITIESGTVTAVGGGSKDQEGAAGIGGGYQGAGQSITISGGTVTATGNGGGAGIGGGSGASGSGITVTGGTVTATGTEAKGGVDVGAGIGGGSAGDGREITVSGGMVTALSASRYAGAGIGGGSAGDGAEITVSGGSVYARSDAWDLVISGKTVSQGMGGAGIGGGKSGQGSGLRFTGGAVCARSSKGGASIGGGAYYEEVETDLGDGWVQRNYVIRPGAEAASDGWTALVFRSGSLAADQVTVSEAVTLPEGAGTCTIGTGRTVVFTQGGSLTIPEGVSLWNNGTIRYPAALEAAPIAGNLLGNVPERS